MQGRHGSSRFFVLLSVFFEGVDKEEPVRPVCPQVSQSPVVRVPSQENICAGCGKPIRRSSNHCPDCSLKNSTASLIAGARLGRVIGHSPLSEARRRESKQRHDLARNNWSPSDHPSWLTEDFYSKEIQPRLKSSTLSKIALALGVSIPYASDIRKGRRIPHPRHWRSLADLGGAELNRT